MKQKFVLLLYCSMGTPMQRDLEEKFSKKIIKKYCFTPPQWLSGDHVRADVVLCLFLWCFCVVALAVPL